MDFQLSSDQRALQDMAQKFSREKLAPKAGEWDEKEHFPLDVLAQSASLGFAGTYVPENYGGSGLSRLDAAIIFESLSHGCISTAAYLSVHNMVAWILAEYGSEDHKKHFLPRMTSMQALGSYCLTEPGAGSDAASLKTKAVKDGGDYVITGNKTFITAGGTSEIYVVMARTGEEGPNGISAIVLEKGMKGLSFGKPEQKMGWRSQPTNSMTMESVRVPQRNLLGKEGDGFKIAMKALDGGRINIAACSLGGAKAAMDMAMGYAESRKQFGRKIMDFQANQFKFANMAIALDAARLMTYRAAQSFDSKNPDLTLHAAMAKKFASEAAFNIADEALQLHGGYGYIREYQVERILRDLRVHRILEGTNEIMQLIIARKVLETYAA
ncbi:MAG: acyl-CoA dehydrogenase [Alphaproteobacteria bacterium]|nr:MAG: acyl-CoA dehydrogenase [Alphaproteobacteria bacterium]